MGVTLNDRDYRKLMKIVPTGAKGEIDYADFAQSLFKRGVSASHMDPKKLKAGAKAGVSAKAPKSARENALAFSIDLLPKDDILHRISSRVEQKYGQAQGARKVFRLFDEDNDGAVSPHEFRKGLKMLGFDSIGKQEFNDLISRIDTSQTGMIAYSDFANVVSAVGSGCMTSFGEEHAGKEDVGGRSETKALFKTKKKKNMGLGMMRKDDILNQVLMQPALSL